MLAKRAERDGKHVHGKRGYGTQHVVIQLHSTMC